MVKGLCSVGAGPPGKLMWETSLPRNVPVLSVQMHTPCGQYLRRAGLASWAAVAVTSPSSWWECTGGEGGVVGKAEAGVQQRLLVLQTSQPTLETFQDLLHRHPDAFYLARTAKALQAHWQLMKQYYLLEDQTGNWPQGLVAWVYVCECDMLGAQLPLSVLQ